MVAMFDGILNHNSEIYVSNLIAIYSKGFFLDFLIDFLADFNPMFYL
jgi:hypothetical protein